MGAARWIELDGAANVRDIGGLPTDDGHRTRPGRLIRSDNLQGLTPRDVRLLIDRYGVRRVADLRTGVEVAREGPGPMLREAAVSVHHLSLFPEAGEQTDVAATDDLGPVVLPWQTRGEDQADAESSRRGTSAVYLRYLVDRADSVLAALRLIAEPEGATVVHCAAGKDRTGVVVALALAEVGVARQAIVEDYVLTAERIEEIFGRLRASSTYAGDLAGVDMDRHRPRAATMERLLDALDEEYGGVSGWLRRHGWSDGDAAVLRSGLVAD